MKRDMDLVRQILLKMEKDDHPYVNDVFSFSVEGYTDRQVAYHFQIMAQANLIHMDIREVPSSYPNQEPLRIYTYSMSWHGHEFMDASRDNSRWEKVKDISAKFGGLTVDIAFKVLTQLIERAVMNAVFP